MTTIPVRLPCVLSLVFITHVCIYFIQDLEHLLEDLGIGCEHDHEHSVLRNPSHSGLSVAGGHVVLSQQSIAAEQPGTLMDPGNYNTSSNYNVTELVSSLPNWATARQLNR